MYVAIRLTKLNIRFLVPRPHPLTAGRLPSALVQLNYIAVTFWMYMYILSVAT